MAISAASAPAFVGTALIDLKSSRVFADAEVDRFLGFENCVDGHSFADYASIVHPSDRARLASYFARVTTGANVPFISLRVADASRGHRRIDAIMRFMPGSAKIGQVFCVVVDPGSGAKDKVAEDVRHAHHLPDRLSALSSHLKAAAAIVRDITTVDGDTPIKSVMLDLGELLSHLSSLGTDGRRRH